MRLGTKDGGDGVRCWNVGAVTAYVDQVNVRESQIARDNPDIVLVPGQLVCYGCEVMEYGYGVKCTAQLTRTRYLVAGEVQPRAEDAAGSLLDVPGLLSRAPQEVTPPPETPQVPAAARGAGTPAPVGAPAPQPEPPEGRRGGLRGLFGR